MGEAAQEMLGERERGCWGGFAPMQESSHNLDLCWPKPGWWVVGPLREEGLGAAPGLLSLPAFYPSSQLVFTVSVHPIL